MEVQSSLLTTTNPLLSATSIVSSAGDASSPAAASNNHKLAAADRCDVAAELNGGACTNGGKTTNGNSGATGCFSLSPASSHSEIEKELQDIALNGSKSLNGSAGSLSFVGVDATDDAQCKSQNGSLSGISDGSVSGNHATKSTNGAENEGGVSASGSSTEQTNGQASELMGGSTSSQSAAAQLKKRISSSRTPTRKARRIKFYRNGDRFYPGITIPVSNERYRSFDSLFEDLTRMLEENVKIPGAVRTIYTMCGKKVGSLEDFEDGLSYVCSCNNEGFKKIEYNTTSQPLANLNASTKTNNRLSKVLRPSSPMKTSTNGERLMGGGGGTGSPITIQSSVVFPRIVTLIRNGTKPRKIMRLLLNKRNSPTYEHVLTAITQVVRLDTYVRKVFTLYGHPVTQLSDFFGSDDVFFAYGAERVNAPDDFKLEPEEQKAIQAIRKTLRTAGTTCKGPKPKMPVKKSENIKTMAPGTRKSAARVKATAAAAAAAAAEATNTKPSTADSNSSPVSGEYEAYLAPEPASGEPTIDATSTCSGVEEVCAVPLLDCDIDINDMPPPIRERYSLGPVIGDGNFAVVLKIKDRQTGLPYALKIIDKSKCKGKEHYIDAEVRVMKKLQHPHIISLIMDVDQRENMFLVLEYVSGGDLFDAITRVTRFSENQSRVMIRHLASAMAYLHSMSIVHRDIKPENLMVELDDRGNVLELKLADFGLACEVTEPLTAVCGTPTYVAPEILMETGYDLKIDVWAAGIILYILLCGFPPFVSPDNEQEPLFDAIIKGVYEFPEPYWSDIGDGVRDLINNMLQSDPEVRFSSEDILDHYWTMEEERDYSDDYSS